MKTTTIQKDYTTNGRNYQVKISVETDILIPSDDNVRLLDAILVVNKF